MNVSTVRTRMVLRLVPLFALALAAIPAAPAESAILQAHRAYYQGQYGQALSLYLALAKTGDAEAAERAAFMLLEGPALYGPQVRRDVERATRLLEQAVRSERPAAGFMLNMLHHPE
jgi:TPR repeat protein